MRRIWAVLALIAALTLPSVVAAFLPPAETAHAELGSVCKSPAPGVPSECVKSKGAPPK